MQTLVRYYISCMDQPIFEQLQTGVNHQDITVQVKSYKLVGLNIGLSLKVTVVCKGGNNFISLNCILVDSDRKVLFYKGFVMYGLCCVDIFRYTYKENFDLIP